MRWFPLAEFDPCCLGWGSVPSDPVDREGLADSRHFVAIWYQRLIHCVSVSMTGIVVRYAGYVLAGRIYRNTAFWLRDRAFVLSGLITLSQVRQFRIDASTRLGLPRNLPVGWCSDYRIVHNPPIVFGRMWIDCTNSLISGARWWFRLRLSLLQRRVGGRYEERAYLIMKWTLVRKSVTTRYSAA